MMKAVSLIVAAAALGAIASPAARAAQEAPSCVRVQNISGYSVIDSRHLLLRGGASAFYLVTTRNRCSGMRAGAQIGLSFAASARVCPSMNEFIIPDDGWRCAIDTIEEVDSKAAAEALIAERAEADVD